MPITVEATLEERVAQLEAAVAELKQEEQRSRKGWKSVVGLFRDDPEHEEVVRLGKEYRNTQGSEPDSAENPLPSPAE